MLKNIIVNNINIKIINAINRFISLEELIIYIRVEYKYLNYISDLKN